MKLIYSPEAVQDLIHVRDFIAQNNSSAANRIASELIARIEQLCLFPEIGRVIEQQSLLQSKAVIRDFSFGNYVVRYIAYTESLAILRIWHHYENRN